MSTETEGPDLFSIEQSHGKARLTQPRLTDLGTVGTEADRHRDHDTKGRFTFRNRAAADRRAKRALSAPLRAAKQRLAAADGAAGQLQADALLADAGALYAASRRELGATSVLVLGALVTHAVETVLAAYYARRAAELGLDSEEGMAAVEMAHKCETQAARAMTAALAGQKAIGGKRRGKQGQSPVEIIMAAGEVLE